MELYKNSLIEWGGENGESRIERLLWIGPNGTDVYTIDIDDRKAWPALRNASEIRSDLETRSARILEVDPYSAVMRAEEEIRPKHQVHRDKYWQMIQPLVEDSIPRIFVRFSRESPIHILVQALGVRKGTIYEQLRRYWQRGQTKNALLPAFESCGWKTPVNDDADFAQVRKNNNGEVSKKKLGTVTRTKIDGGPGGVNVDDYALRCFRIGRKYFYERQNGITKKAAYLRILTKFFHCGYELKNGVRVPVLPPATELPSYRQFCYWLAKEEKPSRLQKKRQGEHRFNLTGRALLGDSTQMAQGPGSIFQIDATIGDCYLVSSLDRNRIIGRPVVYFVVDLFSHMVTGFSVSLEGPSFMGAMLALHQACSDKVEFCAEYDVPIEEWEWPASHFPEGLIADRGELEGPMADHLVNAFGLRLHNTAPGRADLKGLVERYIGIANERVIKWVPGAVRKKERGDRDYRLDATLDLHEFRKLILLAILHHNKNHRMNNYRLDEVMIADGVEPTPLALWSWGIKNRSGHLRKIPDDRLRVNLLPGEEASITEKGIRCKGLYYTCERGIRDEWFERARKDGRKKVRLARDPRNLSKAYLRFEDRLVVCNLVEADKTFAGRDWYEATEEFELRKLRSDAAKTPRNQGDADFTAHADLVIKSAKKKTKAQRREMSDRARVRGIKKNRQHEKYRERDANNWIANTDDDQQRRRGRAAANTSTSGYVPPSQPMDKLRQPREGRI
jgi:putative transposase